MADSQGRTPKSERTRAAILTAARELFAAHGYERTTVRDIAARASIDAAMVMRYFGSKDALFARAADFDLRLPSL
ncbi:MAG: helix-turn-helix domain-containing protein, partial [Hyphomicrobiaceae bacterium]